MNGTLLHARTSTLTATTIRWPVVMQGIRWGIVMVALAAGFLVALPAVWAADGDAAETPEIDHTYADVFKAIEETKRTDPALADQMIAELEQLDPNAGHQLQLAAEKTGSPTLGTAGDAMGNQGNFAGGSSSTIGSDVDRLLLGPPVDTDVGGYPSGGQGTGDYLPPEAREAFHSVFDQVEAGKLTEAEARAQAEQIREQFGLPEWDHEAGEGWKTDGRGDTLQMPVEGRSEGFDRAWEQMSHEAREQLEGKFGSEASHEGPGRGETERGTFERGDTSTERYSGGVERDHAVEAPAREYEHEGTSHEYEAPERSYEAPERTYEAPERTYEAPERTYEMPEHEYTAPEPMHEYEAPMTEPR